MKITFEDGSVMEFSGSAEGGELTEKEQEIAKKEEEEDEDADDDSKALMYFDSLR